MPQTQSAPAAVTFEAASVRLNKGSATPFFRIPPRGTVVVTGQELRTIVALAYEFDLRDARYRLKGGDVGVLSSRFDITATMAPDTPPGAAPAMLRTLLADRFRLRAHTERRDGPVYALEIAKNGRLGTEMRRSSHDCQAFVTAGCVGARRRIDLRLTFSPPNTSYPHGWDTYDYSKTARGVLSMAYSSSLRELARRLQAFLDRPVIDSTGLIGSYAWRLTFAIRDESDAPGIFTAVAEQLGLRLRATTAPAEVLIIDSVSMPDPD
jgi:uncharacterized protein (TIGR03435 family)